MKYLMEIKNHENKYPFEKGKNYYVVLEVYRLKPIVRWKYKKTDTKIETERRLYLFRERINIYI